MVKKQKTGDTSFMIHDTISIKLLTRLRSYFSNLNGQKFQYSFRATINPMNICSLEAKTALQDLLRWNLYFDLRIELVNDICAVIV